MTYYMSIVIVLIFNKHIHIPTLASNLFSVCIFYRTSFKYVDRLADRNICKFHK